MLIYRAVSSGTQRYWTEGYQLRAADGGYVSIIDQLSFSRDQHGAVTSAVGAMFSPVQKAQLGETVKSTRSELMREIQHALTSDSTVLLKSITDNTTSGLFLMDSQGYPTFMNPAATAITGWTLDEITHQPLHYAIHYKKPNGEPYPMEECPLGMIITVY